MSKTTFFKRIALTAIAALGFGMLSVAPSQAAAGEITLSLVANGTASLTPATGTGETGTAATFSVSSLLTAGNLDSLTVKFIATGTNPTESTVRPVMVWLDSTTASSGTITVLTNNTDSHVVTAYKATDSIVASTGVYRVNAIASNAPQAVGAKFGIVLESAAASVRTVGTYSYTVIAEGFSGGVINNALTKTLAVTITISKTAATIASESVTIDPSKTKAVLNAGTVSDTTTADAAVSVVATASTTAAATISVNTRNAAGTNQAESITVTVTGPGLVGVDSGAFGKSVVVAGSGQTSISVRADGTAGIASIVVKTTTVTFPAKTVTFYAKAAKTITVSAYQPVIKVGANTNVVRATALDADGNVWGGAAYIYASAAADALIGSSATPVACSFNSTLGLHECPVAGTAEGTANLKVIDAATVALATATSDAVAVRVSTGVASTVNLSFDKATYAPGEKAQLRIQVLDGAGLAMPAVTITNGFTSTGITTSSQLGAGGASATELDDFTFDLSGWTSATSNLNAGHKTYVVYMPATAGAVTISATAGTGIALAGRVALTATATVVDTSNDAAIAAANAASAASIAAADAAADAAAEAIDAANAATDAANLAAEAADAATVAAEEARDAADAATAAVEALATEVATLMAALKAQITTLANTVAKIAKKVKA